MWVVRDDTLECNDFRVTGQVFTNRADFILIVPEALMEAGLITEGFLNFEQNRNGDFRLEYKPEDDAARGRIIGWMMKKTGKTILEFLDDYLFAPELSTTKTLSEYECSILEHFVKQVWHFPR